MSAFTVGFGPQDPYENPLLGQRPQGLAYPTLPGPGSQSILSQFGVQFPQHLQTQMMFQALAKKHPGLANVLQNTVLGGMLTPNAVDAQGRPIAQGWGGGLARAFQGISAVPQAKRQFAINQIEAPYTLAQQTAGLKSALSEEGFRQAMEKLYAGEYSRSRAMEKYYNAMSNVRPEMADLRRQMLALQQGRTRPEVLTGPQGYIGQMVPPGAQPWGFFPAAGVATNATSVGTSVHPSVAGAVGGLVSSPFKAEQILHPGDLQGALNGYANLQGQMGGVRAGAVANATQPTKDLQASQKQNVKFFDDQLAPLLAHMKQLESDPTKALEGALLSGQTIAPNADLSTLVNSQKQTLQQKINALQRAKAQYMKSNGYRQGNVSGADYWTLYNSVPQVLHETAQAHGLDVHPSVTQKIATHAIKQLANHPKVLTKDVISQYLQKAGNDPKKAAKAAKLDGYILPTQ